jgi:hypothetical protein
MQDSSNKKQTTTEKEEKNEAKKAYKFGGIEEFSLEKIEEEILEESVYLDVFAGSDVAFKENIKPLENVLNSLQELNCISYEYNISKYSHKGFPESRQIGLIAQELQSVYPELVRQDKDGDLQVNYSQISTIALQAVKELKLQLEISNNKIIELEKKFDAIFLNNI